MTETTKIQNITYIYIYNLCINLYKYLNLKFKFKITISYTVSCIISFLFRFLSCIKNTQKRSCTFISFHVMSFFSVSCLCLDFTPDSKVHKTQRYTTRHDLCISLHICYGILLSVHVFIKP